MASQETLRGQYRQRMGEEPQGIIRGMNQVTGEFFITPGDPESVDEETLQPSPEQVLAIARLELQMPTKLKGDYARYRATPNWEAADNLKTMPGRPDNRWAAGDYELYYDAHVRYHQLNSSERSTLEDFRNKKAKYVGQFYDAYKPAFDVMRTLGMRNFPPTDKNGDQTLRVISEHSLTVAMAAQELALAMQDQLLREKIEREKIPLEEAIVNGQQLRMQAVTEVVVGALWHDLTKPEEIAFKYAPADEKRRKFGQLWHEGYGTVSDLVATAEKPELANVVYERLRHQKISDSLTDNPDLAAFGNMDTIRMYTSASGMPVVDRQRTEDGQYLPSLGERIINMADKLANHTGLVDNLGKRHAYARGIYKPVEKVDEEYRYAAVSADEFAQEIGLPSGDDVPGFVINSLVQRIDAIPHRK